MIRKCSITDQVSVETSLSECLSSPRKRPRYSFSQTPASSGSFASSSKLAANGSSSSRKFLETPRMSYPLWASDLPSGRKHKECLLQTLLDVTSFNLYERTFMWDKVVCFTSYMFPWTTLLRTCIVWLHGCSTPLHTMLMRKNRLGDVEHWPM